MHSFQEIMNRFPEQVVEIDISDTVIFTLANGQKVRDDDDVFGSRGSNEIFPNLRVYEEAGGGDGISADLSKTKHLTKVFLKNSPKQVKGAVAKALKNATVILTGVDRTEATRIQKLFPNSYITYIEDGMEMQITPKKPVETKTKTNTKPAGKILNPATGRYVDKDGKIGKTLSSR